MIQEFVDNFIANEKQIKEYFLTNHPDYYFDIVKLACKHAIKEEHEVIEVTGASYQDSNLYVIKVNPKFGETMFFSVLVAYGSCSYCDTIMSIKENNLEDEEKVNSYYQLALNVVQEIRSISPSWEVDLDQSYIKKLNDEIEELKNKIQKLTTLNCSS